MAAADAATARSAGLSYAEKYVVLASRLALVWRLARSILDADADGDTDVDAEAETEAAGPRKKESRFESVALTLACVYP